jgi:hypothetical protein
MIALSQRSFILPNGTHNLTSIYIVPIPRVSNTRKKEKEVMGRWMKMGGNFLCYLTVRVVEEGEGRVTRADVEKKEILGRVGNEYRLIAKGRNLAMLQMIAFLSALACFSL